MKKATEKKVGEQVVSAVITVPAYFEERQKSATLLAAQLAGLNVTRLLSEPTAAVISHYWHTDRFALGENETLAVLDFGGGTFDVSFLKYSKGKIRVIGVGGDIFLGGEDVDQALTAWILDRAEAFFKTRISRVSSPGLLGFCTTCLESSDQYTTLQHTSKLFIGFFSSCFLG